MSLKTYIQACKQKFIRAGEVLGHFDKYFVKNSRKKGPAGKNFGIFFSQILLKLHFES